MQALSGSNGAVEVRRERESSVGGGGVSASSAMGLEEPIWEGIWKSLWAKGLHRSAKKKLTQMAAGTALIPKKIDKTVKRLPPSCWISALELNMWDNIFGPRIEILWNGCEDIGEEVQIKTSRHSLSGELGDEEKMDSTIETKFHVFSEIGYIMMALLFVAPFRGSVTKFSFCVVMRQHHLSRYLTLHTIIQERLTQLILKFRILLMKTKDSIALSKFNKMLPDFISNSNVFYNATLPPVDISNTFFVDGGGYDAKFLARAIASHLQTRHSTVVVGPDVDTVNSFVDSLALFLNPTERAISCYAKEGNNFVPDLYLQGLVAEDNSVTDNDVIWSRLPTTVISLRSCTVFQTLPYNQYTALRRDYMGQHMRHAVRSKANPLPWASQGTLLQPFTGTSPWVEDLLLKTMDLPLNLRAPFIAQKMRYLLRKAVLLLKQADYGLSETDMKDETDFLILLAVAEKISPGIYVSIRGNPAALQDEIVRIFDTF